MCLRHSHTHTLSGRWFNLYGCLEGLFVSFALSMISPPAHWTICFQEHEKDVWSSTTRSLTKEPSSFSVCFPFPSNKNDTKGINCVWIYGPSLTALEFVRLCKHLLAEYNHYRIELVIFRLGFQQDKTRNGIYLQRTEQKMPMLNPLLMEITANCVCAADKVFANAMDGIEDDECCLVCPPEPHVYLHRWAQTYRYIQSTVNIILKSDDEATAARWMDDGLLKGRWLIYSCGQLILNNIFC